MPLFVNVPVFDVNRESIPIQSSGQLLDQHHRAVSSTGTPESHSERAFALPLVQGQGKF
jgi:hypothetical protein